jgi:hypothetical protein
VVITGGFTGSVAPVTLGILNLVGRNLRLGTGAPILLLCITERLTRPSAADLVLGVEGHTEAVMLARLLGLANHDLADVFGDLRPTAADELVVDPQRDHDVAVPAVAEPGAQLVVNPDQPALADDRFRARHDEVQRAVQRPRRDAASVEAGQPSVPLHLRFQLCAQFPQPRRGGYEPVQRLLAGPRQRGIARMRRSAEEPLLQVVGAVDLVHGARGVADDPPRRGGARAVEEGVAETLGTLADRLVCLVLLVA